MTTVDQQLWSLPGDVRWPMGGWLRRVDRGLPQSQEQTQFLAAASYDGPKQLAVLASIDNTGRWGPLLHVSLSYADRDPSWMEIKAARETFFPADVDVMMVLPRQEDYVNLHAHTFHLWQTPERWGMR